MQFPDPPSIDGRLLPSFLVIGAQKAGSTSMFRWIEQHPEVITLPEAKKGPHFFDKNWQLGVQWYSEFFPTLGEARQAGLTQTGEGTASYLYYPRVAARVRSVLPEARIVALLREPCARTYSHYQHNARRGRENRSFEEAIDGESDLLQGEIEKIEADETYFSNSLFHFGYLARSRYAEQVEAWLAEFPAEQCLFVRSEDLYSDSARVFDRVIAFLGLSQFTLPEFVPYNPAGGYAGMSPEMRRRLENYFAPSNERLLSLLGPEIAW